MPPITMTVRPRLWRLGALKVYATRMAPLARLALNNITLMFVQPFRQIQTRGNWRKAEWRKPR